MRGRRRMWGTSLERQGHSKETQTSKQTHTGLKVRSTFIHTIPCKLLGGKMKALVTFVLIHLAKNICWIFKNYGFPLAWLLAFARETKEEKKKPTFVEHLLRPRLSTSPRHSSLRTGLRGEQETEAQTGSTAVCLPLTSVHLPNPVYGVFMVGRPWSCLYLLRWQLWSQHRGVLWHHCFSSRAVLAPPLLPLDPPRPWSLGKATRFLTGLSDAPSRRNLVGGKVIGKK